SDIEVPKNRIGGVGESENRGTRESGKLRRGEKSVAPIPRFPDSSEIIPVTYVPARNTIFLSFALSWPAVLEAPDIFIGANAIDYSGYPDCRPEYFRAFESMSNLSTKISVEGKMHFKIHAPLISLTKAGIIKKGISLGLDYAQTWSCYDPQEVTLKGETANRRTSELEKGRKGESEKKIFTQLSDSPILQFP